MSAVAAGQDVLGFFAELGVEIRVDRREANEAPCRCFANPDAHKRDDRDPSCSVNLQTGAWRCHGCGESGNAYKAAVLMGQQQGDAAKLAKHYGLFGESDKVIAKPRPTLPHVKHVNAWRQALQDNGELQYRLWQVKGWSREAMFRLGLGWDGERVIFPILNERLEQRPVGIVRYLPGGGHTKSRAMPGSQRQPFPAPEIFPKTRPLFIVEGEPDAVSVYSAGFFAVAIPGSGNWRSEWSHRFFRWKGTGSVYVMADCDEQGRGLAERIKTDLPFAEVIDLDSTRTDGYDIGDVCLEAAQQDGNLQAVHHLLASIDAKAPF